MKLGLVIDLDTCVGCHACAVACKEWNGQSLMAGGAPDYDGHGAAPSGVWFNRVRHYEFTAQAHGAAHVAIRRPCTGICPGAMRRYAMHGRWRSDRNAIWRSGKGEPR